MNSNHLIFLIFATVFLFATCAHSKTEQKPVLSSNDYYNEIVAERLQNKGGEGKFEAEANKGQVHHQYHVISFEASGMPLTHGYKEAGICKGWWQQDGYNLTNKDDSNTQWFLKHCYIVDGESPQKIYPTANIDFSSQYGRKLLVKDWLFRANNSGWEFKFGKCDWTYESNLPKTIVDPRNHQKVIHFRH